ncbi:MAG: carboxypeptidase regulatory-like domain-containing protein [Deltaproteobacteria bacterium]|nr:carboxypeptidase regulatory-like domain-containing protein [Deltaproteobacteria bacterium]
MRSPLWLPILMVAATACDDYIQTGPDKTGNHPPPRMISGGGVGDGAIDGVVHVYVVDEATRKPVANAAVRVGDVDGTTDETGLFSVEDVKGPQTIAVKAEGYRSELWAGANGANVTINVVAGTRPPVKHADLSGAIGNINGGITVPAGHEKVAVVTYSQSEKASAEENNIAQPNNQNVCTVVGNEECNFTVSSRIDKKNNIALIATIFDRNPANGSMTVAGWAYFEDLDVDDERPQTDIILQLIPASEQLTLNIDFGAVPSALTNAQAVIGVDIKNQGTLFFPAPVASATPTIVAPRIDAFRDNNNNTIGKFYRLLGLATDGQTGESVVLTRDIIGTTTLAAGGWLTPPTGISMSRADLKWTSVANATATSIEITQGSTNVLNVSVLDGATSVDIPDLLALPSGQLTATVKGLGAPGLDVTNFALDQDYKKLTAISSQRVTIN